MDDKEFKKYYDIIKTESTEAIESIKEAIIEPTQKAKNVIVKKGTNLRDDVRSSIQNAKNIKLPDINKISIISDIKQIRPELPTVPKISIENIPKIKPEYISKIKSIAETNVHYPRLYPIDINKYNLIQIVQALHRDVETLKEWRKGKVDPDISNIFIKINNDILPSIANSVNIAKKAATDAIYASDLSKNIINKINNEVVPSINNSVVLANKAKQLAQSASDYIDSIVTKVNNEIIPNINSAADLANKAKEAATKAANFATNTILKMQLAGEVLYYGAQDIYDASTSLFETIIAESGDLSNEYIDYATTFYEKGKIVATEAYQLGSELIEAYNETKPALTHAVSNAKAAAGHKSNIRESLEDLSEHIRDLKWDKAYSDVRDLRSHISGFVDDTQDTFAYLLYKGADGQDSVLLELMEGIQEIGKEATDLSIALGNFGISMKDSTISLGKQLKNSYSAIRRDAGILSNTLIYVFAELKKSFSEEYTPQQLAEERAKYRSSLDKYLSFKEDLHTYEKKKALCEIGDESIKTLEKEANEAYDKWQNEDMYWRNQYTYYRIIENTNEYKNMIAENNRYAALSKNQQAGFSFDYYTVKEALRQHHRRRYYTGEVQSYYYRDRLGDITTFIARDCIAYSWICEDERLYCYYDSIGNRVVCINRENEYTVYERNKELFNFRVNYEIPYEDMLIKRAEIKKKWDNISAINKSDYDIKKAEYDKKVAEVNNACTFKDSYRTEFISKFNIEPEQADLLTYEQIINL